MRNVKSNPAVRVATLPLALLAVMLCVVGLSGCSGEDGEPDTSATPPLKGDTRGAVRGDTPVAVRGDTPVAEAFADTKPAEVDRYVDAVHRVGGQYSASLSFSGIGLTDDDLAALELPQSVTSLDLSRTKVTDAGLAHLKRFPQLTTVNLAHNDSLTDAALDHLLALPNLTKVILHSATQAFSPEKSMELMNVLRARRQQKSQH